MAYGDRSQEEIDALLQTFPDAFMAKFGQPLNKATLESWLYERRNALREEAFAHAFSTLTPKSIDLLLASLDRVELNRDPESLGNAVPVKNKGKK